MTFLRRARWTNPPRPRTVLPLGFTIHTKGPNGASVWNIAILVLQSTLVENRPAVSTGVCQASRRPAGLEFGPNDSNVVLKPRLVYVPKVLSIPFRAQVIARSALSPSDGQPCQGPENIHWVFCLVQKVRTVFSLASVTALKVALLRNREFLGG